MSTSISFKFSLKLNYLFLSTTKKLLQGSFIHSAHSCPLGTYNSPLHTECALLISVESHILIMQNLMGVQCKTIHVNLVPFHLSSQCSSPHMVDSPPSFVKHSPAAHLIVSTDGGIRWPARSSGCSSMVEHLLNMCEALSFISSNERVHIHTDTQIHSTWKAGTGGS